MMNLVSLLAAAALVSMQLSFIGAQLLNNDIDNNLSPIVDPPAPRRRARRGDFVRISEAPPPTLQHVVGTALELRCKALGHPAPVVRWERNGEPVGDFGLESNELLPIHPSSVGSTHSVFIITTPSSDPEDVYSCVATAGLKRKAVSTTVFTVQDTEEEELNEEFLEGLTPISNAPRIVTYMSDLMQNMGTTAVLPCQIQSYSKAQVHWEGKERGSLYGEPRMRVLPSGDLLIHSLRFSDLDKYNCTVKNAYGSETISTFLYPMMPSKR